MQTHSADVVPPSSPRAMLCSLWRHRELILQMAKREVLGRYRGSVMGLAWSLFNPILMLIVYTFVFAVVFKARWGVSGGGEESKTLFAVVLFVGLLTHGLFAEVVNRAPALIVSNTNYVKKVLFPLEILPAVVLCASMFHCLINLSVLLAAFFVFNGFINSTVIFAPIVLLPLAIFTLGVAWMLASLGVFLRDVGQTIGIVTTIMLFLAPVMYPITAVPERFHKFIVLNPLTIIIEEARKCLIWGQSPDWGVLSVYLLVACITAWLGFFWFQRTRKGFADVV